MFYCDKCARKSEWPITSFKSRGRCEVCGKSEVCNDMPSRLLPMPLTTEDVERHNKTRSRLGLPPRNFGL